MNDLLGGLVEIVGEEYVISADEAQRRFLKDFSWYSPILVGALSDRTADAVVRPGSLTELEGVVALAVSQRVPITMRGAGTGNYGQSIPLRGGIVVDVRRLNRVVEVGEGRIAVEPGVVLEDADSAARKTGQEMAIMSSTFHIATAAGFVAGGSGGIGSVSHGRLWDGNVLALEVLTAENPPQRRRLEDEDIELVVHTYGTVGVITRVEYRLVPARTWREVYARFDTFPEAARFAWETAADQRVAKRLVSLHEGPIPTMFPPVRDRFRPDESAVLLMLDEPSLAAVGERVEPWPKKPAISQFAYSHTILWTKKHDPDSTWLQMHYAGERDRFLEQLAGLSERFGRVFVHHCEFARPRAGGLRPSGIPMVTDPEALDPIMAACTELGVGVMNPHSYVVGEGGMVDDVERVLAAKRETDPYGLLNPGKVEGSFYESPAGR